MFRDFKTTFSFLNIYSEISVPNYLYSKPDIPYKMFHPLLNV